MVYPKSLLALVIKRNESWAWRPTLGAKTMKNTSFLISISLPLLALLAACSGGEVPSPTTLAATVDANPVMDLEEGTYGIVQSGDLSSEVTWTIYSPNPLQASWVLQGSDGSASGSAILATSGPSAYRLSFSQNKVEGADIIRDLGVFGGKEATDAVLSVVPTIEAYSAFRYSMEIGASPMTGDKIVFQNPTMETSQVSQPGWVPGSVSDGEEGAIASFMSGGFHGSGGNMEVLTLGKPIYLMHYIELNGETSTSHSVIERSGELMITYSTDSQERREVTLSEFEGRAWALKLTLAEVDF